MADLTPTEGMREEAQRYRDWKAEGRRGGTSVAARRASQILSGEPLSPKTVQTMAAWFARHEVDKQGQGFSPGEKGYPSPGRVAWAAWGGDAGQSWSNAKMKSIEADRMLGDASRPYPNEHAARLINPDQFDEFRRKKDAGGPGVDFIFGVRVGKPLRIQAIRFDADRFTAAEARDWLKKHNYKPLSFEEATKDRALQLQIDDKMAEEVQALNMEREISPDLKAHQVALYESLEEIADEVGSFDKGMGASGAHYMEQSPFAEDGVVCANCSFFAGPRACEIVEGDIAPEGACKFWIVPETLMPAATTVADVPMEVAADRAMPGEVSRGDFVSWNSSGGTAKGRIERIETNGTINVPNSDFNVEGTEEDPAALIRVFSESADGWQPTDTLVGHRLSTLDKIEALRSLEGKYTRAEVTSFSEVEERSFEFPFSSEYPVARYFGNEVLSHERDAANLARLNDGAPLLFNHNPDKVVGVVERAWIDGEKKRGYVKVRFSRNAFAKEVMADVKDGVLRGVSFGYSIDKMEERGDNFVATRWSPYEVSVTSIAADPTIGIGRSLATENAAPAASPTPEPKVPQMENTAPDVEVIRSAERHRIATIAALGDKHGLQDLARELIDGGRSVDEARAAVLDKLDNRSQTVEHRISDDKANDLGLTEKETREFSFIRALNYLANPGDRKAREQAGFEIEVGEAAAKKYERSSNGIVIPNEVLRRDLVVGTSTAGGNLVSAELLSGSFIDLLRNRMAMMQAGVTMLSGLQGNISIPRQSSAATAYWVGEGGSPTESQQAIDQVNMTPKTVGAFVDYSRRLLLQSSIDVEGMIRSDLARVIALELDRAAIYGTGSSNQPLGLTNTTGIGSQAITTYGTFAEYIGMETDVATANADAGALRYIVNAAARGALKSTEKSATSTAQFVYENDQINGYPVIVSNQLTTNDCLFGDFSQFVVGMWSGLDLTVDPYAGSTAGTVRIIALQDVDFAVKQPGAFCFGT